MEAHPALFSPQCKAKIKAVQNLSQEQLKEMVQKILDERLETVDCRDAKVGTTIQFNDTIIEMLDNLDGFR